MSGFTYEIPDEKGFMKALLLQMKVEGLGETARRLEGSKCEIVHYGQFSYMGSIAGLLSGRWNAYRTYIIFRVPIEKYEAATENMTDETKQKVIIMANNLIPKDAGLDVMEISLSPSIEPTPLEESIVSELETSTVLSEELTREILPDDIKARGKEMADTYVYLYCVENALRFFLEKVGKGVYGDDFFSRLQTSRDIDRKVRDRKSDESKNKWLSIRGDSEVFYLDFDDLGSLIRNNWEIFEAYFPSQEWIVTRIDELSRCRNLVAHNSYIGKEERDLIRVYFNTIMKQIASTIE